MPQADALLDAARTLRPYLEERTAAHEAAGCLSDETIARLKQSGFFKILQPRRWGGYELSPSLHYAIQIELARADMSVGWVTGVMGTHSWQLALFDDRAARDVWGDDPDAIIASSYMPKAQVKPVKGGYMISGHWQYSSGSRNADWLVLGGILPEDGEIEAGMASFLVPRQDVKIVDNWDVQALKGTGSHDVVIDEAFVPSYRVHTFMDGFRCDSPGNKVNTGPLYRIPFGQILTRCISTPSIGGLQSLLDHILNISAARTGAWGGKTAEDPSAQYVCAEVAMHIEQLKTSLQASYDHLEHCAINGITPERLDRLRYRYQSAEVTGRCADLGRKLFKVAGAPGIFADQPFMAILNNLLAAGTHNGNSYETWARAYGAALLGLPNDEVFI